MRVNIWLLLMWGVIASVLPVTIAVGPEAASTQAIEAPTDLSLDGNVRLYRSIVPILYTLDLSIDPSQEGFSGEVTIRVTVRQQTSLVRLHAQDMRFDQVFVERDGYRYATTTSMGKNGGLTLHIDPPLPVGPARLHFSYSAPFSSTLYGLYRIQARGRWYAFTQFQSLYARRAFPLAPNTNGQK